MPKNFVLTVTKVSGECIHKLKEGDRFEMTGLKTPVGGFCGGAFHALFPHLMMKNFGGKIPALGDAPFTAMCPDQGKVTFCIETIDKDCKSEANDLDKVSELLKKMGIDEKVIKPEAHLSNDLGIDSTEMVELVVMLEKSFSIEVKPSALNKFTVDDLVKLVEVK